MDQADAVPIGELLDERRFLLDLAYWMLGSAGEAESVVEETYLRWYGLSDAERAGITAPRSWLAKTAGGICLSRLPLPDLAADPPQERSDAEGEEVSRVLLDALDSLPPAERAAFVLNDVFGMTP
ncbi:sigma factor, partial [Streptomyces sp. NPDC050263]|uniref:sigma factor n=1 Tax=Streptomyces sp. NPDC050263 TaxID=3155037 RepID=UPI003448C976